MRVFNFFGDNQKDTMAQVRDKLGEDAIIISQEKNSGGIKIVAALEEESLQEKPKPKVEDTQKKLEAELIKILRFHKLPIKIVEELIPHLAGQKFLNPQAALEHAFFKNFKFSPLHHTQKRPIMLIGMPGIGKTLAISKMMTEAIFEDRKVNVITTDIKRAGGVEQLTAFTKILKIDLQFAKNPDELKTELDKNKEGITLIDSYGVNPYDRKEVETLLDLLAVADIEPILVVPAGIDVEEAVDMARALRDVGAERMIITKADSARRFGSIITVARILNLSFANFSDAPNVVNSLEPITPKALAELIMSPLS